MPFRAQRRSRRRRRRAWRRFCVLSGVAVGTLERWVEQTFERFWQERSTARRGAGLGLAIAKAIAQAHGGRVWAESTPGEGSTFHLYLPASDACNDAESEARTAHSK